MIQQIDFVIKIQFSESLLKHHRVHLAHFFKLGKSKYIPNDFN